MMDIFYDSCVRQCEKFPVACFTAQILVMYGQQLELPPLEENSAGRVSALVQSLPILLPYAALLGAIAVGEFCDWARAQVGDLAKTLDPRAGVSRDWRLHPPELADAYEQWCRRQIYHWAIPWLCFVLHLQVYMKQNFPESCATARLIFFVNSVLHLPTAVLGSRVTPAGHATLQGATVAIKGLFSGILSWCRDPCFFALGAHFFESRISMMLGTAMFILPFCALYPVSMENTLPVFSLSLAANFATVCLRFHLTRFPTVELADLDFWAVVGALMVTILGGQVALVIRYLVGIFNMRCFLRARSALLNQQIVRPHHD